MLLPLQPLRLPQSRPRYEALCCYCVFLRFPVQFTVVLLLCIPTVPCSMCMQEVVAAVDAALAALAAAPEPPAEVHDAVYVYDDAVYDA